MKIATSWLPFLDIVTLNASESFLFIRIEKEISELLLLSASINGRSIISVIPKLRALNRGTSGREAAVFSSGFN